MGREGHHPIDSRKGHHKHIKNDTRSGEDFEAAAHAQIVAVGVLLARPAIEEEHQDSPDDEVNYSANAEAAGGQVALLEFRKRAFPGSRRVEPGEIEILHAKQDGNEQDCDHHEGARSGFERPANHDAPISAGEMLQHEQAERAKRQNKYKHKGEKIGWIKLLRPLDGDYEANNQADDTGDQRSLPETIDAFRRFVVLAGHSFVPPGVLSAF